MTGVDVNYTPGEDVGGLKGKFKAFISYSECVFSQSGNRMLKLRWQLQSPGYEEESVWQNLNLWHSNTTAKRISERQMNQICKAMNITEKIKNSEQLHHIPIYIHVRPQKNNEEFSEIHKVESLKEGGKPAGAKLSKGAPADDADQPPQPDTPSADEMDYRDDDIPF